MKKTLFVLLIALGLIQYLKAQRPDTNSFKNNTRQELAIDLAPLVQVYGDGFRNQFYLHYKYSLSRCKLRLAFSVNSIERENEIGKLKPLNSEDTSFAVYQKERYLNSIFLHFGAEGSTNGKTFQFVYGGDLLVGINNDITKIDEYKFDQPYEEEPFQPNVYYTSINTQEIKDSYFSIGIAPILGVNANINSRFTVGAYLRQNIFHGIGANGKNSGNSSTYLVVADPSFHILFGYKL